MPISSSSLMSHSRTFLNSCPARRIHTTSMLTANTISSLILSCLSARRFFIYVGTVLLFRFICPVCTRCIICRSTLRVYHSYPYLSIGSMNFQHIAQLRYIFIYHNQANLHTNTANLQIHSVPSGVLLYYLRSTHHVNCTTP